MQPDKKLLTPADVHVLFKKVSDFDLHLLGLSSLYARPEWMILTIMPVPPPPVRPSIAVDGGAMRSEDDLTYKLGDIVKASASVRRCEQEGAPAHVMNEFEQLLQVSILLSRKGLLNIRSLVSCRNLHGQRHRWYPASAAKIWPTRQGHSRKAKRQRRPSAWQSDGQTR
jgi:hypothetical protein